MEQITKLMIRETCLKDIVGKIKLLPFQSTQRTTGLVWKSQLF